MARPRRRSDRRGGPRPGLRPRHAGRSPPGARPLRRPRCGRPARSLRRGRGHGRQRCGDLAEVPDETGGPYPGDGSNGVNVLDDSGIVRSDLTSSFGSSTTTTPGVPLTIRLTVRDAATGDALPGAAVYLWHCTADGNYSLYSPGHEQENYLRGVQEADRTGTVEFASVFPGCYSGRWPHVHFEVYDAVADAVDSGLIVKTSQIALPAEAAARSTPPPATRPACQPGRDQPRRRHGVRRRRRRPPARQHVRRHHRRLHGRAHHRGLIHLPAAQQRVRGTRRARLRPWLGLRDWDRVGGRGRRPTEVHLREVRVVEDRLRRRAG